MTLNLFKKKISERTAVASTIPAYFSSIEKHWPALKKKLLEQSVATGKDQLVFQVPSMAPIDLVLALIALDLQALPNIFPSDQAKRIHNLVLTFMATQTKEGTYAREEIELYEEEWKKALNDPQHINLPYDAISNRLLHRWLYGKETIDLLGQHFSNPILVMAVSEMLLKLSGAWEMLKQHCKVVSDRE
ncbi:MAG: hypothetical protein PHS73_00245 [Candidatus Peribacteraceae bacterium]|nr:hypothetical protein [Candidatus Peribacteraceae bacterium]